MLSKIFDKKINFPKRFAQDSIFVAKELKKLKKIFDKDNGSPTKMSLDDFNRLWIKGEDNELYLRYSPEHLTIARIELKNTGKGTGTEVLKWLKKYAISKGFKYIIVEAVSTNEMANFCQYHKFEPVPALTTNTKFHNGNWRLNID
ncbi:hypothetical protein [Aneurinibacillus aneurinilyticus]|nr:hypothetical protein [Aneurinibacillus aneurinilyticus]MED0706850.1 hypothetical protein [Aneurinibacillus aneurinilyticus]MED0725925.1 hypothetical protein [Aneurinibacillus aneurinilyticus]MED0730364.1 hypothetical protein [Aneurinibacillus aneurinilyticus]MED0739193.1 hypothetical protein [Aneurinibacillus aneurinilyticus]